MKNDNLNCCEITEHYPSNDAGVVTILSKYTCNEGEKIHIHVNISDAHITRVICPYRVRTSFSCHDTCEKDKA